MTNGRSSNGSEKSCKRREYEITIRYNELTGKYSKPEQPVKNKEGKPLRFKSNETGG